MLLAGVTLLPLLLRPELPQPLLALMPLPQPRLAPTDFPISPEREAVLFSQLDAADREWQPKAVPIPGGGTRYTYKRRAGDPPLNLAQIKLLMLNPPTFVVERRTIALLLLKWLHHLSKANWSLSNLASLLRLNLFTYRALEQWLHEPLQTPPLLPSPTQLSLALA